MSNPTAGYCKIIIKLQWRNSNKKNFNLLKINMISMCSSNITISNEIYNRNIEIFILFGITSINVFHFGFTAHFHHFNVFLRLLLRFYRNNITIIKLFESSLTITAPDNKRFFYTLNAGYNRMVSFARYN